MGLPAGQMGNSEVGHLNLGAGRPVLQDLPRIDAAIADGSFFTTARPPRGVRAGERDRSASTSSGLIGPGGVHANDRHLVALVELAARLGVPAVRVHALLDGRDTPPCSALGFMQDLEARLEAVHPGRPHRDRRWPLLGDGPRQRWERIERGYDAIVHGVGRPRGLGDAAIEAGYARGENDEFLAPTVIDGVDGVAPRPRPDRARQLPRRPGPAADPRARGRRSHGFDPASPDGRPAPRASSSSR